MSTDARNSLLVWGIVTAFFGLGWAALYFDIVPAGPRWLLWVTGLLGALNLIRFTMGLWKRRASNPDNPNK